MRAAEEAAFARGISAEALMDEAAAGIARAVVRFFPQPGRCIVFAGKGNNAGDAFAAVALLQKRGWKIELRLTYAAEECGELAAKKLRAIAPHSRESGDRGSPTIILDGLLGLGSRTPLREPIAGACREINRLRAGENAFVFAIDLPSGLDGDTGEADADCVVADFTITIGYAKQALLADRALDFVGRLEVVPLANLGATASPATGTPPVGEAVSFPPLTPGKLAASPTENQTDPHGVVATAASLRQLLPRRKFSAYKNQFGRVGIVAGSKGLTGAAILCATGALRAGAGLVELFVPEEIYAIVASSLPSEAMVKSLTSFAALPNEKIDVWAIGPGLGRAHANEISKLIADAHQPVVLDADGLNIAADHLAVLDTRSGPRLLTPHPGEMHRLMASDGTSRLETAERFCAAHPVTLLLKGSRTIVCEKDRAISYNTTGNPGMATGGMGDVLTGVCAALIAQNLSTYDAARLGAWLCGRAAEIAIFNGNSSEESLLPHDVLAHLGAAFDDLRAL